MEFTVAVALFAAFATIIGGCITSYFQYKTTKANNSFLLEKLKLEQSYDLKSKSQQHIYTEKANAYKEICSHKVYISIDTVGSYNNYKDVYNRAYLFADRQSREILNELNAYVTNARNTISISELEIILNKLAESFAKDLEQYQVQ